MLDELTSSCRAVGFVMLHDNKLSPKGVQTSRLCHVGEMCYWSH